MMEGIKMSSAEFNELGFSADLLVQRVVDGREHLEQVPRGGLRGIRKEEMETSNLVDTLKNNMATNLI